MFTKQQRQTLNSLCLALYGVESKWQKLLADPNFRMPINEPTSTPYKYVRTKSGALVTVETAHKKGLIPDDYVAPSVPSQTTVAPGYDNLKLYLDYMLDERALSTLEHGGLSAALAHKFASDQITHMVKLVQSEGEQSKKDVEDLLNLLPVDKQPFFRKIVEDSPTSHGIEVEAVTFLGDVVFSLNHPAESAELYKATLEAGRAAFAERVKQSKKIIPYEETPEYTYRNTRAKKRMEPIHKRKKAAEDHARSIRVLRGQSRARLRELAAAELAAKASEPRSEATV